MSFESSMKSLHNYDNSDSVVVLVFVFSSMTNQKLGEAVIKAVGLEEPWNTRSHFLSEDHSAVHSVFLPLLYSEKK